MRVDPRDELWEVTFDTYYDVYYLERPSERLVDRWQRLDDTAKVLVALTASGSAVSGWALWMQPGWKGAWAVFAGIAAVLTIVDVTLSVPRRLHDHGEVKRRAAALRIDLETFRYQMRVDPNFSVGDFTKRFVEYRRSYADLAQLFKNDLLVTRRLERRTQDELNYMLRDEIAD